MTALSKKFPVAIATDKTSHLLRLAFTVRGEKGRLLGADDRIVFGLFVYFEPVQIFFRYRHIRENGLDRTFRQAGIAVDTCVGVDQQFVGQFVKRLDGANCGAVSVFAIYAGFGNDVGHLLAENSYPTGENQIKTVIFRA